MPEFLAVPESCDTSPAALCGRNARFVARQTTRFGVAPCQLVWQERKIRVRSVNLIHLPDKRSIDLINLVKDGISRRALAPGFFGGLETLNRGLTPSLFYTSLCCRFRRACPGGSDNWRAIHQDATEHLPGAFMALRRACPGGSTTCGLGACQLNRCSRRDRPDGERDILLALVANQL